MIESYPTRDQRIVDLTVKSWTDNGWTCEVIAHTGADGGTYWTVKGITRNLAVVEDKRQVG